MEKIVYLIPGYSGTTRNKGFRKVISLFKTRGFKIVSVKIDWKSHTMTGYVKQFLAVKPEKGCCIFGFSFGAVIALISAKKVQPKALILCSLSPYFREDLPATRKVFGKGLKKWFKKRDLDDLKRYSFAKAARDVKCRTFLIAGDKETVVRGKTYQLVLDRAKDAKSRIKNSRLIIVKGGKHDISQKQYHAAIKKVVYKL